MKQSALGVLMIAGCFAVAFFVAFRDEVPSPGAAPRAEVIPDWAAIAAWPDLDTETVDAIPDPNRIYTAIVLDDSGSMRNDMDEARSAVRLAVETMDQDDWVAVIALNAGSILGFAPASEAASGLSRRLASVEASGTTPLTNAIGTATAAIAAQAAQSGGFGSFRILVITDGEADNNSALEQAIEAMARTTPIQITTIGVGVSPDHVLNRRDIASFVAIQNMSDLAQSLQSAIAEEASFSAITSFDGGNDGTSY